eukprot:gnl/Chilomastix_cuspidata/4685.p1 GENE.gnl/Chilomastix_cuspidata/4685~~gnl/Chilomastix_cuspidata/4685.p1  ORF type:complete len:1135 (-),score=166.96 gnl/Chilomastix_cuspidata/4685:2678-6082(-)
MTSLTPEDIDILAQMLASGDSEKMNEGNQLLESYSALPILIFEEMIEYCFKNPHIEVFMLGIQLIRKRCVPDNVEDSCRVLSIISNVLTAPKTVWDNIRQTQTISLFVKVLLEFWEEENVESFLESVLGSLLGATEPLTELAAQVFVALFDEFTVRRQNHHLKKLRTVQNKYAGQTFLLSAERVEAILQTMLIAASQGAQPDAAASKDDLYRQFVLFLRLMRASLGMFCVSARPPYTQLLNVPGEWLLRVITPQRAGVPALTEILCSYVDENFAAETTPEIIRAFSLLARTAPQNIERTGEVARFGEILLEAALRWLSNRSLLRGDAPEAAFELTVFLRSLFDRQEFFALALTSEQFGVFAEQLHKATQAWFDQAPAANSALFHVVATWSSLLNFAFFTNSEVQGPAEESLKVLQTSAGRVFQRFVNWHINETGRFLENETEVFTLFQTIPRKGTHRDRKNRTITFATEQAMLHDGALLGCLVPADVRVGVVHDVLACLRAEASADKGAVSAAAFFELLASMISSGDLEEFKAEQNSNAGSDVAVSIFDGICALQSAELSQAAAVFFDWNALKFLSVMLDTAFRRRRATQKVRANREAVQAGESEAAVAFKQAVVKCAADFSVSVINRIHNFPIIPAEALALLQTLCGKGFVDHFVRAAPHIVADAQPQQALAQIPQIPLDTEDLPSWLFVIASHARFRAELARATTGEEGLLQFFMVLAQELLSIEVRLTKLGANAQGPEKDGLLLNEVPRFFSILGGLTKVALSAQSPAPARFLVTMEASLTRLAGFTSENSQAITAFTKLLSGISSFRPSELIPRSIHSVSSVAELQARALRVLVSLLTESTKASRRFVESAVAIFYSEGCTEDFVHAEVTQPARRIAVALDRVVNRWNPPVLDITMRGDSVFLDLFANFLQLLGVLRGPLTSSTDESILKRLSPESSAVLISALQTMFQKLPCALARIPLSTMRQILEMLFLFAMDEDFVRVQTISLITLCNMATWALSCAKFRAVLETRDITTLLQFKLSAWCPPERDFDAAAHVAEFFASDEGLLHLTGIVEFIAFKGSSVPAHLPKLICVASQLVDTEQFVATLLRTSFKIPTENLQEAHQKLFALITDPEHVEELRAFLQFLAGLS